MCLRRVGNKMGDEFEAMKGPKVTLPSLTRKSQYGIQRRRKDTLFIKLLNPFPVGPE
jgi:hypothetical protein